MAPLLSLLNLGSKVLPESHVLASLLPSFCFPLSYTNQDHHNSNTFSARLVLSNLAADGQTLCTPQSLRQSLGTLVDTRKEREGSWRGQDRPREHGLRPAPLWEERLGPAHGGTLVSSFFAA